jgi:ATP-dependent Clp protease, protease subunit
MATTQNLMATCAQLVANGTTEIYLVLSTPGGQVMAGLTVYNFLKGLPVKLITHNVGNIDSIGNAIFLVGEERIACQHSTFMFHGVGFDIQNQTIRLEEKLLRERLNSILADQTRIGAIIQAHTNIDANEAGELFREARTKDANAALAGGIVHRIEELNIPTGAAIVSLVLQV